MVNVRGFNLYAMRKCALNNYYVKHQVISPVQKF